MKSNLESLPKIITQSEAPEKVSELLSGIEQINKHADVSEQRKLAIRVLETLVYIKLNPNLLRYAIEHKNDTRIYKYTTRSGNKASDVDKQVLRAPNDMAFHIIAYNKADIAIDNYARIINVIEHGIDLIKDSPEQIKIFVNKFCDSDTGCMEARLSPVLDYISDLNERKLSLNDLFNDFLNKNRTDGVLDTSNLQSVHNYFNDKINKAYLDKAKGVAVVLTWDIVKDYLETILDYNPEDMELSPLLEDEEVFLAKKIWAEGLPSVDEYQVLKNKYSFNHLAVQVAQDLERAGLLYQGCSLNFRTYHQGQWKTTVDIEQRIKANKTLFKMIGQWPYFLNQIQNFSHRPALRTAHSRVETHKYELRTGQIIEYKRNRHQKAPSLYNETKKQSTTFLSKHLNTGLFTQGVGLLFDEDFCVIRAMFKTNAITFSRGWVGNQYAVQHYKTSVRGNHVIDYNEFRAYVDSAGSHRGHNEVLAKLSIKSILGLFVYPDTLNNRRIARERQTDLLQNFKIDYPIFFYDYQKQNIRMYTKQEQEDDVLGYRKIVHDLNSNPLDIAINQDDVKAFIPFFSHSSPDLMMWMMKASWAGSPKIIDYLLTNSPLTIDMQDKLGKTTLTYAVEREQVKLIDYLLAKGSNINHLDSSDKTVLMHAVHGGRVDIVKLLLTKNPDTEFVDGRGDTALMHAVACGDLSIVRELLNHGANLNHENNSHDNPLKSAIRNRNKDLVDLLVERGADVWNSIESVGDVNWLALYFTPEDYKSFFNEMKTRMPVLWLDIKFEQLMFDLREPLIKDILSDLRVTWLNHKTQDAEKKSHQDLAIFFGSFVSKASDNERKRLEIKTNLIKNYMDDFDHRIKKKLNTLLDNQITTFSPRTLIDRLLTRHPWVTHDPETPILERFMHDILHDGLLELLTPDCSCWSNIPENSLENATFSWKAMSEQWLNNKIEGYPLSHIHLFYYAHVSSVFPKHDNPKANQWLTWPMHRIDVFRHLASSYLYQILGEVKEGLVYTYIAPKLISELSYLTPTQLNCFETLLINVNTEEQPVWIVLNQNNQQWIAYLPPLTEEEELYHLCRLGFDTLAKQIPSLSMSMVDFDSNLKSNDIHALSLSIQWQAVVFGRVLPWCRDQKDALSNYRSDVPIALLWQSVLLSILPDDTSKHTLNQAFALRSPMTEHDVTALISLPRMPHQLIPSTIDLDQQASRLLKHFDDKTIVIDHDDSSLLISSDLNDEILIDGLSLVYHHSISCLKLAWGRGLIKDLPALTCWFDRDINLRSIIPVKGNRINHELFHYASACAARNRFLAEISPKTLEDAGYDSIFRKYLFENTGSNITHFFHQSGVNFDLNFINSICLFRDNWYSKHCDNLKGNLSHEQWAFLQITQMGTHGLDVWFNDLIASPPEHELKCTLDLSGTASVANPADYIHHLNSKIKSLDQHTLKLCFKQLSLILPQTITEQVNKALVSLLVHLNTQFIDPDDQILLFNVDINDRNSMTTDLIQQLMQQAEKGLLMMIRVPAWDNVSFAEKPRNLLQSSYHAVQNKILDNQRVKRALVLPKNTEYLYAAGQRRLQPEIIVSSHSSLEIQSWDELETWYPLTGHSLNIQQQNQQQQQQQQQQVTKNVIKEEPENPPLSIEPYSGNEQLLITRTTKDWGFDSSIMSNQTNYPQLFSLWVGSEFDAEHLIEKIEPAAALEMLHFANQFRGGIDREHLPDGFYLARSQNSLVLCFDDQLEHEPKPFKLSLYQPKPARVFAGDYRQLVNLRPEKSSQQSLWNYLADNSDYCLDDHILSELRQWGVNSGLTDDLMDVLFHPSNEGRMTEDNLNALGQLFHDYGSTEYWFYLAQQMWNVFGDEHFLIWKKTSVRSIKKLVRMLG